MNDPLRYFADSVNGGKRNVTAGPKRRSNLGLVLTALLDGQLYKL